MGLAVAGVTAAVGALVYAFREDLPDAATVLERHSQILDRVTSQYDDLKTKLDEIGKRQQEITLRVDLEVDRKAIERQIEEEMRNLDVGFTDRFATQFEFGFKAPEEGTTKRLFDPIRQQVDALRDALKRGEDEAVVPFRKQMAYLYEVAGDDKEMRAAIEAALEYTNTLADLTTKADEAAAALDRMGVAEKGGRLRLTRRDQERGLMDRMDPEGMDAIRQGLKDQAKDLTGATTEVDRYSKAVDRQTASLGASVAALQSQIDHFGQSEGAMAAARFQADAMAQAQAAAAAAGKSMIDPALVAEINRQAAAYGAAADKLAGLNAEKVKGERLKAFDDDLAFRQDQLGRTQVERQVAQEMRAAGLQYGAAADAGRESTLRYLVTLEDTKSALKETGDVGRDAFEGIAEALLDSEGGLKGVGNALAQLGRQMAGVGLQKLGDMIFGTGRVGAANDNVVGVVGRAASTFSGGGSYGFSGPSTPLQAKISASDFASASGQVLEYSSRFQKGVDGRLMKILETAASRFDMRVEAISGQRDPRRGGFHPKGLATDVQIYDGSGRALDNYQNARDFRAYERFAQVAKQVQTELYPELEKLFRWGGYFSGPKGKYGALDSMHFDLGGAGMAGGSWAGGLTAQQRAYYPGVQSVGMGGTDLARAVEVGSINATRKVASGNVPGIAAGGSSWGAQFSGVQNMSPMVSAPQGGLQGFMQSPLFQGGLTALTAGMSGYQSGDPLGGALGGALQGLAMGNPIMAGVGAVAGPVGGKLGRKQRRAA